MSDGSLTGKTVLITGGARRVGAEVARLLHAAGANLVIHYRRSSREAAALAGELNAARGRSAAIVAGELLDIDELPSLVEFAVRSFGALDVLINNASTFYPTKIGEITPAAWDDLLGTNLKVPTFLSQAAAPALRRTQGCIVNITDIHAERPLKSYVVYSIAKAGLVGLTRSLARELAPDVRVNAVAPGPILWPDEEVFDELARQRIISHTPLRREGSPDDVAKAVLYLLADAPYVTGETLNVDGGRHIAM